MHLEILRSVASRLVNIGQIFKVEFQNGVISFYFRIVISQHTIDKIQVYTWSSVQNIERSINLHDRTFDISWLGKSKPDTTLSLAPFLINACTDSMGKPRVCISITDIADSDTCQDLPAANWMKACRVQLDSKVHPAHPSGRIALKRGLIHYIRSISSGFMRCDVKTIIEFSCNP